MPALRRRVDYLRGKSEVAKNIEAEKPKADVNDLAGMVLTF